MSNEVNKNLSQALKHLNRRNFLRGVGTTIALPVLSSLAGSKVMAAPSASSGIAVTPSGAPLRTAFVYFPNGAIPEKWWPEQEGAGVHLANTLEPLDKLRNQLQLLGGLDHENATAGSDGAGDHARGNGTFLTGVRVNKSATDIRAGVSIDQVIAREVGHLTRFPSLELSCDAVRKSGACDSGYACAYQYNVSWSSPTTPMTPEVNPRHLFERMFGSGSMEERARNLQRRRVEQRSILDFVMDDAHSMQRRLGAKDREKLDEYLGSVREIEKRLENAERFDDLEGPAVDAPEGIPQDFADYIAVMFEMMVLAFQTDSTRVATMLLAHDGSNRSFDHIGISEGHHELSHHQNKEDVVKKVQEIDRWYVEQFARFLTRLQQTPDQDGNSLLQNSMIVYGSGNADGNRHTHTNLPIVLAGGGGGTLTTGRYKSFGRTPACNMFLGLADRMGVTDLDRFGDSTDRLNDL